MCRSLAIGRLLLELAAPALEDDFVGLLGDPIIQQAGDRLHEVPRRFGDQQIRDPAMHEPLALVVGHRKQVFEPLVHHLALAGGEQHGDEAIDLGNAFHWRPLTRRRYWLRAPRAAISRNRRARRRRTPPGPCRSRLRPPGGSSRAPTRWPALCEAQHSACLLPPE